MTALKIGAMLKLLLKLAISATVFAIVIRWVDIGAVGQVVAGANVLLFILAFVLSLAMVVTDAVLWQSVLGSLGHRISLGTAILYSIVGCFFGSFGPSWTGADIFRAAQMRRLGIPLETAIRAVVATRLVTFVSLLAVISCGLPIVLGYPLNFNDKLSLISFVTIGIGLIVAIVALGPVRDRFPLLQQTPFVGKVAEISNDLMRALTSKSHSPAGLLFATLTHILRITTFAAIAAALHASVNFAALYALIPISLLVAMIPISLGSWGVREASVIYFMGWVGVPAAMALSISVIFGILRLVVAAIGGIVWIFARSHHYGLIVANASDQTAQASTEHCR